MIMNICSAASFYFKSFTLLPPVYIVRQEGTVFTGVCLSTGGVSQLTWRGISGQSGQGGSGPAASWGGSGPTAGGGVRSSCRVGGQVQQPGGSGPAGGGQSSSRGGGQVQLGGVSPPTGGSAKIAQHREYLLHGRWYASCVHAGGLSCFLITCCYIYNVVLLDPNTLM